MFVVQVLFTGDENGDWTNTVFQTRFKTEQEAKDVAVELQNKYEHLGYVYRAVSVDVALRYGNLGIVSR